MTLAVRESRWRIRIPDQTYKLFLRAIRFVAEFSQREGRPPSLAEIGEKFHRSPAFFQRLLSWNEQQEISLSTPVGDHGTSVLADFIEDRSTNSQSDVVTSVDLKNKIAQVLRTLTPREEKIIKMRFGLEGGEELALSSVGKSLDLGPERTRQIEVNAIRKLRHPARARVLKPFLREGRPGQL